MSAKRIEQIEPTISSKEQLQGNELFIVSQNDNAENDTGYTTKKMDIQTLRNYVRDGGSSQNNELIKIVSVVMAPGDTQFEGGAGIQINAPLPEVEGYTAVGVVGINVNTGSIAWREWHLTLYSPTGEQNIKGVRVVGKVLNTTPITTSIVASVLYVASNITNYGIS